MVRLNQEFFTGLTKDRPVAEGYKNVFITLTEGLKSGKLKAEHAVPSFKQLGLWLGAIDPMDEEGSWRRIAEEVKFVNHEGLEPHQVNARVFTESNLAVRSQAFATLTSTLISSKMIDAYEAVPSVADTLMTIMPNQKLRNQRLAGLTHIAASDDEVLEGHPYPETDFSEKYVTTKEEKRGRILRLTEELMIFDQTGECYRRAAMLGTSLKNEQERRKIRLLIDADSGSSVYVYRPSGTGETLYNTDASNMNYIGNGGVTGFSSASPLVDWTDLDLVRLYRATKVTDDRIDGTARPIGGINTNLTLLVPEGKRSVANTIVYPTQVGYEPSSSGGIQFQYNQPVAGFVSRVVSSPFIDEVNGDDYYIGDFNKQFVWTEIWPLRTAVQGRDSEDAFNQDLIFSIKASYFGGLSAVDSIYVTKVDGA